MNSINEELAQAALWLQAGERVALATVIDTWGSSPRPLGSHLVVNGASAFCGSVSGGCIEPAVIAEALAVIADGKPRTLEFGVSDEEAWEVGLSCGGAIVIFVERLDSPEAILPLIESQQLRQCVARITQVSGEQCGRSAIVWPDRITGELSLDASQQQAMRKYLHDGQCLLCDDEDPQLFVRSYITPLRLVIVGAVHIARSLVVMANEIGMEITVIDPRSAFCQPALFPAAELVHGWPDEVIPKLPVDAQTAFVILSHDAKIDDPALVAALSTRAFYVGALGSRRTHAKRLDRLASSPVANELLRIRGPIGLDLGGRATTEIAVSILAEIIQQRYRGKASA